MADVDGMGSLPKSVVNKLPGPVQEVVRSRQEGGGQAKPVRPESEWQFTPDKLEKAYECPE